MWSVVLMETRHSRVKALEIQSPNGPTRDGLDLVDGSDIQVDGATIQSEDDSICLKSGVDSGLEHVKITNSHVLGSTVANGVKFGTASRGPLRDVSIQNLVIENVRQAAMAIESVDGSQVQGVSFQDIQLHNVGAAFYVVLGWRGALSKARPGSISDLSFRRVTGDTFGQTWGSAFSGSPVNGTMFSLTNITLADVNLKLKGSGGLHGDHLPPVPPEYAGQYPDPRLWKDLPAAGLYFRHVEGLSLRGVHLSNTVPGDARPLIVGP
jgi:hypothetical protein